MKSNAYYEGLETGKNIDFTNKKRAINPYFAGDPLSDEWEDGYDDGVVMAIEYVCEVM